MLSGVPRSLPAMVKAFRIGQKAAAAGFDWGRREDVWEKVQEETDELRQEIGRMDRDRMEEELGDPVVRSGQYGASVRYRPRECA